MKGYNAIMTKKRYNALCDMISRRIPDETTREEMIKEVKNIFNYDPTLPSYNSEYVKRCLQRKKSQSQDVQQSASHLTRQRKELARN